MTLPDTGLATERPRYEADRFDPFAAALRTTRLPAVLTDPLQADDPIVFANDAFLRLTGYTRDEVEGRNCRFLQGAGTDPEALRRIGRALRARDDIKIDILNYRKDGSAFWNALSISPVFDEMGRLRYFFGVQADVTERRQEMQAKTALLREIDHRVKNNLQMVSALVALQMSRVADESLRETLSSMLRRIEALATLHRRLHQSDDATRFSVADFIEDIVTDLVGATGRTDLAVELDLDPVRVSAQMAAPFAIIVNELVTNVLKHAFAGRPGRITVRIRREDGHLRLEVADDGLGMPETGAELDSFGTTIVRMLARQLKASLIWSAAQPSGTRAVLRMPLSTEA
jgi:PAS domain S-box-containing protein